MKQFDPIKPEQRPVAVDADGVIFDFLATWEKHFELTFGRSARRASDAYWLSERYGVSQSQVDALKQDFPWSECDPIPGAINALADLVEHHDVVIVTGLDDEDVEKRKAQFARYGFKDLPVIGSPMRSIGSRRLRCKREVFSALSPIAVIGDQLHHLQEAAELGVPRLIWAEPKQATADPMAVEQQAVPGLLSITHLREAGRLLPETAM